MKILEAISILSLNILTISALIQVDEDGGYIGIDVAVHNNVSEDPLLLDNLKQLFTDASQHLYNITGNRFYFKEIAIRLPYTWTVKPEYKSAHGNAFATAHVRIDATNLIHGNSPYTLQPGGCGEEGQYIHLTPDFIKELYGETLENYGPPARQLVHEWAHLKYGVFDEYGIPGDKRYPMFYHENGRIRPSSCNKKVRGWIENVDGGPCYILEDGTVRSDCIFIPDLVNSNITASLMYMPFIPSVHKFCEDDGSNAHNSFAPTQQNTLCNYRSIWNVISSHTDFSKAYPKSGTLGPYLIPQFNIFQHKARETSRIVLLLDVSGSMAGEAIELLHRAASRFVQDKVPEDSMLGVIAFSTYATILHNLVVVNTTTRQSILSSLPRKATGATAIGKGLQVSLKILGNYTEGSLILLITDGEETEDPRIAEVLPSLINAKVVVNTIAFGDKATDKLENLAKNTGGKVFFFSLENVKTYFELDSAFLESVTVQSDVMMQQIKLVDDQMEVNRSSIKEVYLESELGLNTVWTFVSPAINLFGFQIIDPDYQSYMPGNNSKNVVISQEKIEFHFDTAKPGKWKVNISSKSETSRYLSWSVISEAVDVKIQPIRARSWIGDFELEFPAYGRIYAEVKQGYNAVINARVIATVDCPLGSLVDIELKDNGFGADTTKDDGIYSAYFTHFNGNGRYSVVSRIVNNGGAQIKSGSSSSGGLAIPKSKNKKIEASSESFSIEDFIRVKTFEEAEVIEPASHFQRTSTTGSFKVINYDKNIVDPFPPSSVLNLETISVNENFVTLRWISPGNDLDNGQLNRIELRASLDPERLLNSFNENYLISEAEVKNGSLKPPLPGEYHTVTVNIPEIMQIHNTSTWSVYFAVKGFDDYDNSSPFYNIISADFGKFGTESNHYTMIVILICILVVIVGGMISACYCRYFRPYC